ncbi:FLOT1 protein, partial [Rhabdornis inornatus]|nr:FLOT1 protein [Rhabdornis inornatus]
HSWDTGETQLGHSWDPWDRSIHTWDTPGTGETHLGQVRHTWDSVTCPISTDGFVTCPMSPVSPVPCPLSPQAARSRQAIAAQRGEVALVERAQRAQLQEQEVGRRRQELEATVRKPAEAERYRLERLAEAHR